MHSPTIGIPKRWLVVGCALTACLAEPTEHLGQGQQQIIYGEDDREETSSADSALARQLAESSPALIFERYLDETDPSDVRVVAPTLREGVNLCEDERFAAQTIGADCGATLVAPDVLLTAGHCIDSASCASARFVFGYRVDEAGEAAPLKAADVYRCAEVVAKQEADADYAIVKLDRAAAGRAPVRVRLSDAPLAAQQSLFTIGYPTGLPQKLTTGAWVADPRASSIDYFTSNLDAFPGSSGGGVFTSSGELVGIVARGPTGGYVQLPGESCYRPEQVGETYSIQIESTYVQRAVEELCARAPIAALCSCGDQRCDANLGEDSASCAADCGSRCGDGICNGSEAASTCYADCGVCGDGRCDAREIADLGCCQDCGCPGGFACAQATCQAREGNVNADDRIDGEDVRALERLAHGSRDYSPRADVDGDGRLTRRDVEALTGRVQLGSPLPGEQVEQMGVGLRHACAVQGGRVRCWGDAGRGQLGTGPRRSDASAADAAFVSLPAAVTQLSVGSLHTCVVDVNGQVTCWGENQFGQLGRSQPPGQALSPVPLTQRALRVSTGDGHTCALLVDRSVTCWGDDRFGQLGGGPGGRHSPLVAVQLTSEVQDLALGAAHSCALLVNGDVRCWGANQLGQLGLGHRQNIGDDESPETQPTVAIGGKARLLRAHWQQTCAVREDGAALCWGDNSFQQLGYPLRQPIGDNELPIDVGPAPLGPGIRDVALGQLHACGIYVDGVVRCWGFGPSGQLGSGAPSLPPLPTPPGGIPAPATLLTVDVGAPSRAVFAGAQMSCAASQAGALTCWGANQFGQLGYPRRDNVGDNERPASAGPLPLLADSSTPWRFTNARDLKVERSSTPIQPHRGRTTNGERLTLRVRNESRDRLPPFHLLYSLSGAESRNTPIVLRGHSVTSARPTLSRRLFTDSYLLDLDFADGLRPRQRSVALETIELEFADSLADWDTTNDYGATEDASCTNSRATPRVQLVLDGDEVVYGYTRATEE